MDYANAMIGPLLVWLLLNSAAVIALALGIQLDQIVITLYLVIPLYIVLTSLIGRRAYFNMLWITSDKREHSDLFEIIDSDNDGYITAAEFAAGWSTISSGEALERTDRDVSLVWREEDKT